jgi:hypothetical protein
LVRRMRNSILAWTIRLHIYSATTA